MLSFACYSDNPTEVVNRSGIRRTLVSESPNSTVCDQCNTRNPLNSEVCAIDSANATAPSKNPFPTD